MNFTSIEKKNINKIDKKDRVIEANIIRTSKNFNIKKIEPKKVGMKNMMGNNQPIKNYKVQSNTISLAEKLSDISEKLDKYEVLVNKFAKDFPE